MLGTKPKLSLSSPLEKGGHPELDTSEYLDSDGVQKYQSMIGAIQWSVYLGRLNFNTAVIALEYFRVGSRKGHLGRYKIVV